MTPTITDERIEQARAYVRSILYAADHANQAGEDAVLVLAAAHDLLKAAREAYTFITQPKVMAHPTREGPTVLTYETSRYNELTGALRKAFAYAEGR